MQKICFYTLLFVLFGQLCFAQQIKTDVLVSGSGPGAIAAAIQSARSGVKTLLISENELWGGSMANTKTQANPVVLQNGIWSELIKNYQRGDKDSKNSMAEQLNVKPDSLMAVLKLMADTVKNLSMRENAAVNEIKKSGKGWEIRLKSGQKVKTAIWIDATADQHLLKKNGIKMPDTIAIKPDWKADLYRTSVAALDSGRILPLAALVAQNQENVIGVPAFIQAASAMHAGQAAGAIGAYCAFFKTTTKNLNVRLIQAELLNYKASLIPFGDIDQADSNWVKYQHLAVSGLLNAGLQEKNGLMNWMPEKTVSSAELKNPMKEFYSRSQIWFADNPAEKLSIEQAINPLKYTATRGDELKIEIERCWKTSLGFKTNFEPQRAISRGEFTVLLDTYLQPFTVKVNLKGQLLN